jgi:hypothetical protein
MRYIVVLERESDGGWVATPSDYRLLPGRQVTMENHIDGLKAQAEIRTGQSQCSFSDWLRPSQIL